jgi:hypothetical protein
MAALNLRPGDTATVEIDANQFGREPLTVNAGPIESIMMEPMGELGGATRLYGRVWTSGPRVVIRYYRGQRARGNVFPICAVARLGGGHVWGPLQEGPPRQSGLISSHTFSQIGRRSWSIW